MDNSLSFFFSSASSLIVSLPRLSSLCTLIFHLHLILYELFHLLWASLHVNIISDCSVTVNIHCIFEKLICLCTNKWNLLFQVSAVMDIVGKFMGIRAIKEYIYYFKNKLTTWPFFFILCIWECLGQSPLYCLYTRFWGFCLYWSCFIIHQQLFVHWDKTFSISQETPDNHSFHIHSCQSHGHLFIPYKLNMIIQSCTHIGEG